MRVCDRPESRTVTPQHLNAPQVQAKSRTTSRATKVMMRGTNPRPPKAGGRPASRDSNGQLTYMSQFQDPLRDDPRGEHGGGQLASSPRTRYSPTLQLRRELSPPRLAREASLRRQATGSKI